MGWLFLALTVFYTIGDANIHIYNRTITRSSVSRPARGARPDEGSRPYRGGVNPSYNGCGGDRDCYRPAQPTN